MELHRAVMPRETLESLDAVRAGLFVDATVGMGGHTELILRASPANRVIGFDRDAEAVELASQRLAEFGERFTAVHTDYRRIKEVLAGQGIETVAGILADLGVSSYQLNTPERGFSFRSGQGFYESPSSSVTSQGGSSAYPRDANPLGASPLDMRMDRSQKLTAADLVNDLSERELADIIFEYGEERAARRIARRIVRERAVAAITTTEQLADLVIKAIHLKGHWRIHPATKTFQALRIAVNRELEGLGQFVADAVDALDEGGRLVVITFHSLEDRIIKQALRFQSGRCQCPPKEPECRCGATRRVEILTRKAIQPGAGEVADNPRSRSAKLRACRKI
ncbi:MAG: 16S rRNA (cytosine(1402)-N(4))-methyltransferase RsmH [Acidobacteria bacterium]|nr:16S rRNA (cytosine(1402)-N(4))-methyltransferase RsmH [Acidobacteriota bacterium]